MEEKLFRLQHFLPLIVLVMFHGCIEETAANESNNVFTYEITGDTRDLSGLSGRLEDGTMMDQFGGISGMCKGTEPGTIFLLSDRGPKDGATSYICRFHIAQVYCNPFKVELVRTVVLKDKSGKPFIGSMDRYVSDYNCEDTTSAPPVLDCEGIAVTKNGRVFISDEYGPYIVEFDLEGNYVNRLPVPRSFSVDKANMKKKKERELNAKGRQQNNGLEGLALSPDEKRLYAIFQSPLLQDNARDRTGNKIGQNVRIYELDIESHESRQFVYTLDSPETAISEIMPFGDKSFLVIERDGEYGDSASHKIVYKIDISKDSDISNMECLRSVGKPNGVALTKKELFFDILEATKNTYDQAPEKWEGLAPLSCGENSSIIIALDNDFQSSVSTKFVLITPDK